jgi:hypothetical protein
VAERIEQTSLPVNAPRRLVVTNLVDAAVRSGRYCLLDEAVGAVT